MPKVSIVVPNYNHAKYLLQRLESIFNQTFQDFEVIILDDCSTDSSRDIIEIYRSHPKITEIIYNETNSGSTFKQWKKGIELAKGEYIWIAESDDWADINFLSAMVCKLCDENVSLVYCRTFSVFENQTSDLNKWGEVIQSSIWNVDNNFEGSVFIDSFLKYRNVIPNASAAIFKKKYFTDIDQILKMRYAGDWLLWINVAKKGDVAFSSKTLNYFRMHIASTRSIKSFKEEFRRIEEYFISINVACSIVDCRFNSFDNAYNWIIEEWIERIKIFGIKKSLHPPYPNLFLLKFYYRLMFSKFILLYKF
jgi:glycosyltransferase involved in cell wall biosynthesis